MAHRARGPIAAFAALGVALGGCGGWTTATPSPTPGGPGMTADTSTRTVPSAAALDWMGPSVTRLVPGGVVLLATPADDGPSVNVWVGSWESR